AVNHRDIAARVVTVASEMPPRTTTTKKVAVVTTTKPVAKATATTTTPVHETTTSSAVVSPVVSPSPSTSSTPVVPTPVTTNTTPLTSPTSSPTTSSSSTSVSVQYYTVTTVEKAAASAPSTSASVTPEATGAVNTGAIAGGVVGGVAGLVLLVVLISFAIRRYRRKSIEDLAFNASKFRRSALLLDDSQVSEKTGSMQEKQRGPRPPTMIAQHLNAPAVPQVSASSPYSEHSVRSTDPYGNYASSAAQYNVGVYGADGQVSRDPYADLYAGNPTYGQHTPYNQPAFGAPPLQFQFPQQQQRQYNQQYPTLNQQQSSFAHTPAPSDGPLPNPFSNAPPSTTSTAALAAARSAAQAPSIGSHSNRNSDTSSSHNASPVLHRRQVTEADVEVAPPAYEEDSNYANIQRDVKVAPGSLAVVNRENVNNASSSSSSGPSSAAAASSASPSTKQRPTSAYTTYDPEDAYGGM
ncbi:hypothetical protein H0H93_007432, partial [Arthromyces matolae]